MSMHLQNEICDLLDLERVRDRNVENLSGGELQRFAIAMVCIQVSCQCGSRHAAWFIWDTVDI